MNVLSVVGTVNFKFVGDEEEGIRGIILRGGNKQGRGNAPGNDKGAEVK